MISDDVRPLVPLGFIIMTKTQNKLSLIKGFQKQLKIKPHKYISINFDLQPITIQSVSQGENKASVLSKRIDQNHHR